MGNVSIKAYVSGKPVPVLDAVFHYGAGNVIDQFFNTATPCDNVLFPVNTYESNDNLYTGGNFTYGGVGLGSIPLLDKSGPNKYNVYKDGGQYTIEHEWNGGYELMLVSVVFATAADLPAKPVFSPKAMSYTEYLRSKKAAAVKIIDTKPVRSASEITTDRRLGASTIFALNNEGTKGSVTNSIDFSQGQLHASRSYFKGSGGPDGATRKVGDASDFTSFRGSQAIGGLIHSGLPPTRILQVPSTVIESMPVPQSASDFVRGVQGCKVSLGEKHDASTLTPSKFVDDTIRNTGSPACVTHPANHSIKVESPFPTTPNRPSQAGGQYALKGDLAPGKDLGAYGGKLPNHLKINKPITTLCNPTATNPNYKAGAALDKIPYIEKHHGNDLGVNPARVSTPYVNVAIQPDQKKINKPVGTFKVN